MVFVYLKKKYDELKENIDNFIHKFPNGDLITANVSLEKNL